MTVNEQDLLRADGMSDTPQLTMAGNQNPKVILEPTDPFSPPQVSF